MLFGLTLSIAMLAMATSLWMGLYLLARGFGSRVTLRAVLVLLVLFTFFYSVGSELLGAAAAIIPARAVLVVVGLGMWYSVTYQLLPARSRERLRRFEIGIYVLGGITATLMLGVSSNPFVTEARSPLYMPHINPGITSWLYLIFLALISTSILSNLLGGARIGLSPEGRYFLVASILVISAVGYGVLAVLSPGLMPRLIMDALIFAGVTFLGISVARHQSLVERRTTFQDFPASGATILGLSLLYALLALQWGISLHRIVSLVVFAILTHSAYDLVHEFLQQSRSRQAASFRRQLRRLESEAFDEAQFQALLQEGLDLLCQALDASGGFIAVRRSEEFVVTATLHSFGGGNLLAPEAVACDDLARVSHDHLTDIVWIAPAFEGTTQIALVGLRKPRVRLDYSVGDLDLLADVADRVGTIVALNNAQSRKVDKVSAPPTSRPEGARLDSSADELITAITTIPDPAMVKMIEDGLRRLTDYSALGQSPLVERAGIRGDSHIERGKALQKLLTDSIESLRPAGARPTEPLPRVWYNYAVLYDAYVEGLPNREIMSRLYVSEGTFNRIRRNAVRSLVRLMMEKDGLRQGAH